jgi:hypothetical protein
MGDHQGGCKMSKFLWVLALFGAICLLGLAVTGCDEAPEESDDTDDTTSPSFPSAPSKTSPKNGAVLYHVPRETTLQWSALSGASKYGVQVMYDTTGSNDWTTLVNQTVATASHTFTFSESVATNESKTVRWRVWGINSANVDGRRTGWSSIIYRF